MTYRLIAYQKPISRLDVFFGHFNSANLRTGTKEKNKKQKIQEVKPLDNPTDKQDK